jgi:hypothetical protein
MLPPIAGWQLQNQPTLQFDQFTYDYNLEDMKTKSSKNTPSWAKQLCLRSTNNTILINRSSGHVLCYAESIGEGKCSWVPVEFKTKEAADAFVNESSIDELGRLLEAPVQWTDRMTGPMPARPAPMAGVTTVSLGAQQEPPVMTPPPPLPVPAGSSSSQRDRY